VFMNIFVDEVSEFREAAGARDGVGAEGPPGEIIMPGGSRLEDDVSAGRPSRAAVVPARDNFQAAVVKGVIRPPKADSPRVAEPNSWRIAPIGARRPAVAPGYRRPRLREAELEPRAGHMADEGQDAVSGGFAMTWTDGAGTGTAVGDRPPKLRRWTRTEAISDRSTSVPSDWGAPPVGRRYLHESAQIGEEKAKVQACFTRWATRTQGSTFAAATGSWRPARGRRPRSRIEIGRFAASRRS
jgi:hypothetical protein